MAVLYKTNIRILNILIVSDSRVYLSTSIFDNVLERTYFMETGENIWVFPYASEAKRQILQRRRDGQMPARKRKSTLIDLKFNIFETKLFLGSEITYPDLYISSFP
jgi:hypothetical protein